MQDQEQKTPASKPYKMSPATRETLEKLLGRFNKLRFWHRNLAPKNCTQGWQIMEAMSVVNLVDRLMQGEWRAIELMIKLNKSNRRRTTPPQEKEDKKTTHAESRAYQRVQAQIKESTHH